MTHVISLWDPERELREWPGATIHCVRIHDQYDAKILPHFEACGAFIAKAIQAGEGCYVHCQMGRSRSATTVIAYLVRHCGVSLLTAYAHVMLCRHVSALNLGFFAQLADYEERLKGRVTIGLLDYWLTTTAHIDQANIAVRDATVKDVAKVWSGKGPTSVLARLVNGLKYVCEQTKSESAQARSVAKDMSALAASLEGGRRRTV